EGVGGQSLLPNTPPAAPSYSAPPSGAASFGGAPSLAPVPSSQPPISELDIVYPGDAPPPISGGPSANAPYSPAGLQPDPNIYSPPGPASASDPYPNFQSPSVPNY
ncbi:MAG: hypothetical protein ISQ34_05225, partial [Rickettsiales bacterium]|nr:hypothetical protein [Rickettsiales bacterium]